MYEVSNEFLAELKKHTRVEHIRGTIGNALFTDSNVLSMEISNRCSDTSDITFGSAYIGQLQATFVNVAIPRGSWGGQTITLFWGLEIYDEETETTSTEWVPVGLFEVASAEWTDIGVNIVANDYMSKLEVNFAGIQTQSAYIYDFALFACEKCGLVFGMTKAEVEALPNGDQLLGLFEENNIKTWRDFMSWLANTVGGFVTADRDGTIVIRSFADSTVVDEWSSTERITGSVFSDYETKYDGISIINIEDQTLVYYSGTGSEGDGVSIALGQNPFLQYGLDEVKDAQRQAIADVAHSIDWTPFQTQTLSSLVYDLGDLITCSDGVAGLEDLTCCVQFYDWRFKNTTSFVGYGADPRLATGSSKTDKNLQGLLSKVESGEITYYQFKNVDEILLGENEETTIASIKFAAKKETDVDIWLEVKLDVENISDGSQVPVMTEETVIDPETGDPVTEIVQIGWWDLSHETPVTAVVKYYYDGALIGYQPVETWNEDGLHTIHYGYYLPNVDNITNHTFMATLTLGSGEASIAVNDATMVLRGQALAGAPAWNGEIEVEDEIGTYDIRRLTATEIEETTVELDLQTPTSFDLSDEVETEEFGVLVPMRHKEGSVSVVLRNVVLNIISEDGQYNITDESGDYNITTEGNNDG